MTRFRLKKQLLLFSLLFSSFMFSLTVAKAQGEPPMPSREDCAHVLRLAALLPPHITAYHSMDGLGQVENIHQDLDRTLAYLLGENPDQLGWWEIDFDEITVECQLSWRKQKIDLFRTIQHRVSNLVSGLATFRHQIPSMSTVEATQWLGEGIPAEKVAYWKNRGMTPLTARLEREKSDIRAK
ncbi:MAG: hypothetical protein HQL67_04580 [Magnetococcales bacterium]|nr:hypothetical protein [Magnetococcales bacterium]